MYIKKKGKIWEYKTSTIIIVLSLLRCTVSAPTGRTSKGGVLFKRPAFGIGVVARVSICIIERRRLLFWVCVCVSLSVVSQRVYY